MKTKNHFCIFSLLSLIFFTSALADLSHENGKISCLLKNSDYIFIGNVIQVEKDESSYHSKIAIMEILKGNITEATITLESRLTKGFYLDNETYLQKETTRIIFCCKNEGKYSFALTGYSVMELSKKEDLLFMLNAYKSDNELFSNRGKLKLIELYSKLRNEDLKNRLLNDLNDLVSEEDMLFLSGGIESTNNALKCFAIKKAGDLKISRFKEKIEHLIKHEKDVNILFCCLSSLGNYYDEQCKDIFISFMNHPDQAIRRVCIEAVGKTRNENTLLELIPFYLKEKDFGNRTAIVEALCGIDKKETLNLALGSISQFETNSFLKISLKSE